jgi:Mg2+/Co2+ transporter CorB
VLIFSEVMPKTYAISRPDSVALLVARPIGILVRGASRIIQLIRLIVKGVLTLLGVAAPAAPVSAEQEIRGAIDLHAMEGGVESADRLRLVGALDLKDLTVEDVMIHRKNIQMLNADMDRRQLVMKALASPHTRLPLYRGEKEEIIGILHAKDLLRAALPLGGDLTKIDLDSVLRKPWFVPETTQVKDQLDQFLAKGQHFALVVDIARRMVQLNPSENLEAPDRGTNSEAFILIDEIDSLAPRREHNSSESTPPHFLSPPAYLLIFCVYSKFSNVALSKTTFLSDTRIQKNT